MRLKKTTNYHYSKEEITLTYQGEEITNELLDELEERAAHGDEKAEQHLEAIYKIFERGGMV